MKHKYIAYVRHTYHLGLVIDEVYAAKKPCDRYGLIGGGNKLWGGPYELRYFTEWLMTAFLGLEG